MEDNLLTRIAELPENDSWHFNAPLRTILPLRKQIDIMPRDAVLKDILFPQLKISNGRNIYFLFSHHAFF